MHLKATRFNKWYLGFFKITSRRRRKREIERESEVIREKEKTKKKKEERERERERDGNLGKMSWRRPLYFILFLCLIGR